MNKKILIIFGMFLLIGIFLIISISATYMRSNAAYTTSGTSFNYNYGYSGEWQVDSSMCEAGQDFVIQIAPFGCEPAVVRSDLLEEQNVPVYCQLGATKINPLIEVEAIESIDFSGNYPKEIAGVGFHPAKAALGLDGDLNSPILNNIGYVVILLRQQSNESEMPDYVSGNLTAKIRYDIEDAYGIGDATFYLPKLDDLEWNSRKNQYSFWKGRGYLRAEGIETDGASVSLYDGKMEKITSVNLKRGEISNKIYLPGFDCLAGLKLKLEGLEAPDTRAKLDINGEIIEVAKGEKFLEERCQIEDINKKGLIDFVEIKCREDEQGLFGGETFPLKISPKINLSIYNKEGNLIKKGSFDIGDYLYDYGHKRVYLGYANTFGYSNEEKDLYVHLVAIPSSVNKDKLTNEEIDSFTSYDKGVMGKEEVKSISNLIKSSFETYKSISINIGKWMIKGQNLRALSLEEGKTEIFDSQIQLHGFAGAQNIKFDNKKIEYYYEKSMESYDKIVNSYSNEKLPYGLYEEGITSGEEAFYRKISLAFSLGQKKTAYDLCEEFKQKYPNSEKNLNEFLNELYKFSNKELSSIDVIINGKSRKISFEGIFEPSINDYSAKIFIEGTDGKINEITLTKGQIYSLGELRGDKDFIYTSYLGEAYPLHFSFISNKWHWSFDKKIWKEVSIEEGNKIKENIDEYFTGKLIYPDFIPSSTIVNSEEIDSTKKLFYYLSNLDDINSFEKGKDKLSEEGYSGSVTEEYIKLVELEDNSAKLEFNLHPKGFWSTAKTVTISNNKGTLTEDTPEDFGSDFIFTLTDVTLKKSAKVSVIPTIDYAGSETNFSFKIGIDKRAIKLSPDKIEEKIENLNKSITDWEEKSEKLGKVVKGLKTACLATGLYLVTKNFLSNAGGKSIARQNIMRSKGGWNEECSKLVKEGNYSSLNECFTKNGDKIESDVNKYYEQLEKQNNEIKNMQEPFENKNWWGEKNVNTEEFKKVYCKNVRNELNGLESTKKIDLGGGQTKTVSEILNVIQNDCEGITVEQLRRMQLNYRLENIDLNLNVAGEQLDIDLANVWEDNYKEAERENFEKEAIEKGVMNPNAINIPSKDSIDIAYFGSKVASSSKLSIKEGTPIQLITFNHQEYYLELEETKKGELYIIKNVYNSGGSLLKENDLNVVSIKERVGTIKKYDKKSYENKYVNSVSDPKKPVLKYYETEPYKEMPALVPVDLDKGWYVSIKQTLPVMGNIQSYDKSGKVTSFYLCNIGENGKEEDRGGDDICEMINTGTGQPYNQFYGLDDSEALKIVKCAVESIEQASKQYGNSRVTIRNSCDTFTVYVGEPAVDVPDVQCQDFMSPKECQWLFNVCDPVICPSSRCNLGGNYHVADVIQSGIIGSIVLCFPNIGEGIYIPVCLTGVQAGLDAYISVLKSYRDCLTDSLKEGELIGICDEIYSIHLCEFFWRQTLPLAEIAIPKLTEFAMGQNIHGGGEYLGVQAAWDNAGKSAEYFANYYASTSFEAFKSKIVEKVGSEICGSYSSAVYPEGGDLLDSLTEPDSPPQYYGRFDEITLTTVTNPPTSQYKVYYHIYAGKESRAYYQVYLKEGYKSSFYKDTSYNKIVDSGYISKGEYVSETKDFTAPSGYQQMCIVVNGKEECGFKQVSTSFAINYVEDKYLEEQASQKDITSEKECISGSASIYSVLNPNLQSAVEEMISPEIYNRGITRICATKNPGIGTDTNVEEKNSRWIDVGYCDDENMRCWLDLSSVKEVIEILYIENETLDSLTNKSLNALQSDGFLSEEKFKDILNEISQCETPEEKVNKIDKTLDEEDLLNSQKVRLFLQKGDICKELAEKSYGEENAKNILIKDSDEGLGVYDSDSDQLGDEEKRTCQELLGEEIIKIAREIKNEKNIDDSKVKNDTGVKNFECLILQLAMQESSLKHCEEIKEGSCLYCDGNLDKVLKASGDGKSYGVMQINLGAHSNIDVENFEENVRYGINYLISSYSETSKYYECLDIYYNGWNRALRYYNGWNTDCSKGNVNYVEELTGKKDKSYSGNTKEEVIKLFPNICGE